MITENIFLLKIILLIGSLVYALEKELVHTPQLVCQDSTLNLKCPKYYKIQMISALYGRLSKSICEAGSADVTDCYSALSERVAKEHCDGKAKCTLTASSVLFGDPCPNVTKYLEVGYSCKRFDGDDRCKFQTGNANSRDFIYVGNILGNTCIDTCISEKKADASINGVSVKLTGTEKGCYCEKYMIGRDLNAEFLSCFLKDDNGILVNLFQQHKMRLKKGKLLTIIRELDSEYELSFEIFPLTFVNKPASVLSLSPASSMDNSNYEIPGILFKLSSSTPYRHSLEICNAIQGQFEYCVDSAVFPLKKWIKVKIKQEWALSYIYSIYINNKLVHNVTNSQPYSFSNVEVYAGDPNLNVQDGYIRKLLIRNKWSLQKRGVCFGSKDESFGSFRIKSTGTLTAIKLVHQSGLINCSPQSASASNWGCGAHKISVAITDEKKQILFPKNLDETGWTVINPYGSMSKEIIFSEPTGRHVVSKGKILRLWYGEDLKDHTEQDNTGQTCTDIYATVTTDRWRSDLRCGRNFLSPSGSIAECDPSSDKPCCSPSGWCGKAKKHCACSSCVDYRIGEADGWTLQQSNICIGSKNGLYGTFELKRDGVLEGFKLKHMAGGVACKDDSLTNWGCHPSNYTTISTVITDENKIVLPAGVRYNRFGAYSLPGYSSQSSILTLRDPFPKYTTQKYFRVGFSEDLMGFESNKTHGWNSCFDVYAKIRVPQLHGPWSLQQEDVCIGSKQNQFGQFKVEQSGLLSGMRLIHKFGGISCNLKNITNWGCYRDNVSKINLLLTDRQNKVILPKGVKLNTNKEYELPGYSAWDDELELLDFKYLRSVTKGEKLRIWFNEDLYDVSESNNPNDRSCFDIYTSVISHPSVFLQLKTINCQGSCNTKKDGNNSCLSSLMMDGMELSNQKDGFNILVLDRNLKVSQRANFNWFTPSQHTRFKALVEFFRNIKSNSIFFIVLQNVCSSFDRTWYYRLASDVNITALEPYWLKYSASIIVGCKDGCPPGIIGRVPFNYYGDVKEYGISFRLTVQSAIADMPGVITYKTTIITSIVVALLFILIVLVLVLYCKRRYYSNKQTTTTLVADDRPPSGKSSVDECKNDLVYDYASNETDKTEHIYAYVDPKTLKDNRAPNGKFAEYITFNGSNAVYKAPSNVPRFEPPLRTPNAMSTPLDPGIAKTRSNHMYTPIIGSYPELDSPCQYEDMNGYHKPTNIGHSDQITVNKRQSDYNYTISKDTESTQSSNDSTSFHTPGPGPDSPGIYMDMNNGHQTYETIQNGECKKKDDPIYQPLIDRRGSLFDGHV